MDIKRREINPIYFTFLSIFNLINTFMFLRAILTFPYHRLFTHETLWSFLLSTIYVTSIFISDANIYLFKSYSLEKYNAFIRNYFSVVAYAYCYTITIEFWIILFIGLAFGKNPFSDQKNLPKSVLFDSFYLHLGIFIIMIYDLICTKRKYVKNNTLSFTINFIFFWYCIAVLSSNYIFFIPAYPFMKDAGVIIMSIVFVASLASVNLSYYCHLYLVKKINKDDDVIQRKII